MVVKAKTKVLLEIMDYGKNATLTKVKMLTYYSMSESKQFPINSLRLQ